MKSTASSDRDGINSHSARPHAPQEFYTSGAGTLSSSHGPSPSTFKKGGVNALALSSTSSALASLDAKDVAQYLTLADFNVLKNITPYEYLKGTWRSNTANNSNNNRVLNDSKKDGYTKILTRRANMVSGKKKKNFFSVRLISLLWLYNMERFLWMCLKLTTILLLFRIIFFSYIYGKS